MSLDGVKYLLCVGVFNSIAQLDEYMEKFLVEFGEMIDKMTQKEFKTLASITILRPRQNTSFHKLYLALVYVFNFGIMF